jgi:hypothetical protein
MVNCDILLQASELRIEANMTDRWRRIKEVYQEALARDPESRKAYVREACGNDEELLR